MINESVKNNANVAGLMGMGNVSVPGSEEVRARIAGLMAAGDGSAAMVNPSEFEMRLKAVMAIVDERQAAIAKVMGNQNPNVNTNNNSGIKAAGVEGDFISEINAAIASFNDQELAGFFSELNAISSFLGTESGSDRLAKMFAESEDRGLFANTLIGNAFNRISEMLGLTTESGVFGEQFAVEFDSENIDNLVAIMWYLDQSINLVNEKLESDGLKGGVQVNTFAPDLITEDDPAALAELSDALRKEKFNLEMAFKVVGVHEMISAMVAERNDKGAPAGIPQASNPASLGMSTSDLVKAFASLIKEELTSAMDRVHAITSGKAEMTDIEKAAVKLGAIKSEILNGALEGNSVEKRVAFEKAASELKAAMQKGAEPVAGANAAVNSVKGDNVKVDSVNTVNTANNINTANVKAESANVNTNASVKAAADGVALPVSASESVNKEAARSVEVANRRASESVAVAVKSASGDSADLPVSAKDSANNKFVDGVEPRAFESKKTGAFRVASEGNTKEAFTPFSEEFKARQAKLDGMTEPAKAPVSTSMATAHKTPAEIPAQNNPAVKSEQGVKAEQSVRTEQFVKAEHAVRTEQAVKAEPSVRPEQSVKAEHAVRTEEAVKAEQSARIGHDAVRTEQPVRSEQVIKAGYAVRTEEAVKAEQSAKIEHDAVKTEQPARSEQVIKAGYAVKTEEAVRAEHNVKTEHAVKAEQSARSEQSVKAGQSGDNVTANKTAASSANTSSVSAAQFADAPEIHATWNPGPDKYGKYASGNPAVQSADAAANNAAANSANTQSSGIASANAALDNMMNAGAAEASADASASAESGDESTSGFDTSSSKANAAAEQADKARATAMARVDQEAVIRQITEKMQYAIRSGAHELRVTLRPEALGEVRMSIRVQGDIVLARMQVESRQVKDIVESNLQSLKDALEKQNLHVGAFSVDVGGESDRSPRQAWREMAEEAGISGARGFKEGIGGSADGNEENIDSLNGELGGDTGRRFGSNTFEYFI
ncbi:MAG: flagellar hook-length control protein FliK [Chitinispirillia bacterium]|nr:flagellar hook-length control protein FliK [Chitinispirillia bacterium]